MNWTVLTLYEFLHVEVDALSVREAFSRVIPFHLDAHRASAQTLLLSKSFAPRMGPTLAKLVARRTLSQLLRRDDHIDPAETLRALTDEAIALRAPRREEESLQQGEREMSMSPHGKRRSNEDVDKWSGFKQMPLEFAVRCRLAIASLPQTLVEANSVLMQMRAG